MRFVLIAGITLLCSFANAADCYVLMSYSSATYSDTEFDYELPGEGVHSLSAQEWEDNFSFMGFSYEYEIPDYEGMFTVSHYDERVREDTHSEPLSLGAGCRLSEYMYFEGAYQYGMHASVGGRVGYVFYAEGEEYRTELLPYTMEARIRNFNASFLGVIPIDEAFSLTARVGVLRGDVEYTVTFPNVPGYHVFERHVVWMPLLGGGAMLQLHERVSLQIEVETRDVERRSLLTTGTLRIHF